MSELKASWTLKEEIKLLKINPTLQSEIDKLILHYEKQSTRKPRDWSNISFRHNLHYIIDNIYNESLLNELIEFNINLKEYN